MPTGEIQLKVDGAALQYRALSRQLRKLGRGDLQRKLTRAIRKEGGPALAAVKAAWLTVDVKSLAPNDRGGVARPDTATGLRRRVARATRIQVLQSGIRITVNGRRVDPKYPSLVFYLNGFPRQRNWRHKVFGHNVWVAQRGQEVFYPTLREFAPTWRAGVIRAMDEFATELESGA